MTGVDARRLNGGGFVYQHGACIRHGHVVGRGGETAGDQGGGARPASAISRRVGPSSSPSDSTGAGAPDAGAVALGAISLGSTMVATAWAYRPAARLWSSILWYCSDLPRARSVSSKHFITRPRPGRRSRFSTSCRPPQPEHGCTTCKRASRGRYRWHPWYWPFGRRAIETGGAGGSALCPICAPQNRKEGIKYCYGLIMLWRRIVRVRGEKEQRPEPSALKLPSRSANATLVPQLPASAPCRCQSHQQSH